MNWLISISPYNYTPSNSTYMDAPLVSFKANSKLKFEYVRIFQIDAIYILLCINHRFCFKNCKTAKIQTNSLSYLNSKVLAYNICHVRSVITIIDLN